MRTLEERQARDSTRRVAAIVEPLELDELADALTEAGARGMTEPEAKGFGRTCGREEVRRGGVHVVDLVREVAVEVAGHDEQGGSVIDLTLRSAHGERGGDGETFGGPIEGAARVRAGERGGAAI